MKSRLITIGLMAAAAILVACGSSSTASDPTASTDPTSTPIGPGTTQLNVVTTIYPVTYFAERVGGDRVQVTSLVRPGVEAHDFEPTPGDILTIADADVLVYTHPAFEGWIDGAIDAAANSSLISIKTADLPDDAEISHDHGDGDDHGHEDDDDHGHEGGDDHGHKDDDDHDDHGHEDEHGHDEEKELLEGVGHIIEEVEDGDITADAGIEEIEELLGGHGHEGEDEHGDEDHGDEEHADEEHLEELKKEILAVVEQAESGQVTAEDGIEQIETIIGAHGYDGHDDHGHKDDDDHDDHGHEDDDEHGHEDGDGHDHGGVDPHVWLNPIEATEQVRAIQAALTQADAAGAATYQSNADALVAELLELDGEIGDALASCTLDHMVVSHEAYGHLAERYGLEQIGLADLSAEFESTPRRIAEIIEEMRELGVSHILQEPILSDDLAQTVAAETDAEVLPLHPMESLTQAELDAGSNYFTVMRSNMESLKTALGCS